MECISGQQENSRGLDMWWPAAYSVDIPVNLFLDIDAYFFYLFAVNQFKTAIGNAVLLVMERKQHLFFLLMFFIQYQSVNCHNGK